MIESIGADRRRSKNAQAVQMPHRGETQNSSAVDRGVVEAQVREQRQLRRRLQMRIGNSAARQPKRIKFRRRGKQR